MKRYKRGRFYDVNGDIMFYVNLYKDAWGDSCINWEGEWRGVAFSEKHQAWVFEERAEVSKFYNNIERIS